MLRRIITIMAIVIMTTAVYPHAVPAAAESETPTGLRSRGAKKVTNTDLLFSVYPNGGNGEIGNVGAADGDALVQSINSLRDGKRFNVHLFTAWSWHDNAWLDAEMKRFTSAGFLVTLTVKYSPPPGREGDIAGYTDFVQSIARRYGSNPNLYRLVIGNEANVTWGNPEASDGPFKDASTAVVRGAIAARSELNRVRSQTQVGVNIAILERETDAAYLKSLVKIGGTSFVSSIAFLGINVYPGLWPVGTGDAYADMVTHLTNTRYALSSAGFSNQVSIDVLENGFPTADETAQAERLDAMVRAVCDTRLTAGVSGYSWFGLLDADSNSDNPYARYGLLRSDLTPKASFGRYQDLIAKNCVK